MHLCGNSITDLTHLFCDVLSHFHLCPCSLNAQCCIKHQISILSSPAATVFFTKISSFLTKSMTWSECDLSRVEHCVGLLLHAMYDVLSSFHHLSTHILFWPARITALLLCRLIVQLLASGAASMLVRKKSKMDHHAPILQFTPQCGFSMMNYYCFVSSYSIIRSDSRSCRPVTAFRCPVSTTKCV